MSDNYSFTNKKVVFHTLGCKLNFAETSAIGRQLLAAGFARAVQGEQADLCIVNTCSVTDVADHKCRQAISHLKKLYPAAIMIVTGCYAQLKPDEIAKIEGVDLVLGANEKFDLISLLQKNDFSEKIQHSDILKVTEFHPSCSHSDRTRVFLKIQDGCDYYCTYCTIPLARGHSRSGTVNQTVAAAENAIAEGACEIILTGVNIGEFGRGTGENFFDLLKKLDEINADVRFRISSIEPNLLTDEIIAFVAESKHFMPHFHIPLQSGADEILKLMKRRYNTELFAYKIQKIRNYLPDAFIGVDVITGVRGETDELFEKSLNFIGKLEISALHVFTYSERQGTKMLEIQQTVSTKEKKRRSNLLHAVSSEKYTKFYNSQIGKTVSVLWESRRTGNEMKGFTENYLPVREKYDKIKVNTVEEIHLDAKYLHQVLRPHS
ncbi:MAG: tRNA (N(6)-L-threonylcarbamoyladenosine(37)-C(2))-methylthiotransferase MtaB [Prevotellaceae bacterium]|jgi:threonylcarbamoyladenosine tRNA methylthiotransferase MtaB|nr:tRNA (N(6)-L-threonylcarbamoyladenosine(37)-C(2))-methylthiotransferase MtaB [Prevotellaceae bacterium]